MSLKLNRFGWLNYNWPYTSNGLLLDLYPKIVFKLKYKPVVAESY